MSDAPVKGMEPCGCSNSDCPIMVCVTCRCSDCKWPGECKGRCAECGVNMPPHEDWRSPPSMHCSKECMDIATARWEKEGTLISVADMTPEQLNEAFNQVGLALVGVGPREPS